MTVTELLENASYRRSIASFFSYIFLELPSEALLENIRASMSSFEDPSSFVQAIVDYCSQDRDVDDILLEVSRDRTRLVRAIDKNGPRPPYESQYVKAAPQVILQDIFTYYQEANVNPSTDATFPADYLGIGFAFLEVLCQKEVDCLSDGNAEEASRFLDLNTRFFKKHILTWVPEAGSEMASFAQTDFYKGIGGLLTSIEELYPFCRD